MLKGKQRHVNNFKSLLAKNLFRLGITKLEVNRNSPDKSLGRDICRKEAEARWKQSKEMKRLATGEAVDGGKASWLFVIGCP